MANTFVRVVVAAMHFVYVTTTTLTKVLAIAEPCPNVAKIASLSSYKIYAACDLAMEKFFTGKHFLLLLCFDKPTHNLHFIYLFINKGTSARFARLGRTTACGGGACP